MTGASAIGKNAPFELALRPLCRADEAVDLVFAGLSERSRELRFHGRVPELTPRMRRNLIDIDGCDRAGIVAEVRGTDHCGPVGIATLFRTGADRAELAVEVADAWQFRGVGSALLPALGDLAQTLGYAWLHGDILRENEVMLWVVRKVFPLARSLPDEGCLRVEIRLGSAARGVFDEDVSAALVSR